MTDIIPIESVVSKIIWIRGEKVLLDRDLARLYGVETRVLKQAVRRNMNRFPPDFMFELTKEEFENWRSHFVISNADKKGLRYKPMAFTEHGVAMLSSVLNSDQAIEVNIAIMRVFIRLRQMLSSHKELKRKIEAMEKKYDEQFGVVFEAIKQLIDVEDKPKKKIGFEVKEETAVYSQRGKTKTAS
ncbi:MAG: ORF6N domain-containing protein [Deltaproteobacteria bacterium]|nr:ORF6N domain-containing protein [Deltaproteobacteria bacterium]